MTILSCYDAHTSAPLTPEDADDGTLHMGDLVSFQLCAGDRTHYGRVEAISASGRMLMVEAWNSYANWVFDHEAALFMTKQAVDVRGDWRELVKEATRREFEKNGELDEWRG